MSSKELLLDGDQLTTDDDRIVGFVYTSDEEDGGYFFTWMDTLDETLDSLRPDTLGAPTFPESDAREFLKSQVASHFAAENA